MSTEKRNIGDIGEAIAARFLGEKGFIIVEQNYLKKWGEIDIISEEKLKIDNFMDEAEALMDNYAVFLQ